MRNSLQRVLVILGLIASASACTSLVVERGDMVMGVDKTVGAGVRLDERQIVLVTVTDSMHEQLSQGESIRGEGQLPPLYARFLAQLYRDYGLERVADWPLTSIGVRCLVFEIRGEVSETLLQSLRAHQFIETAQPMNYFSVSASARNQYDDPYFELQSGHNQLQIPETHAWSTGKGVVVAVIDTGIDLTHPDLQGRMFGVHNFVDRSNRQFRADVHGTAIAGVIAANANNQIGIVGVAPDAQILGLKACEQAGPNDRTATCNSFTLAKALDFAIDQQADIINLSLAGPRDDLLERLVDRAVERGAVVVGAEGRGPNFPFPAVVPTVIAVANAESADTQVPTILAPGTQVVTTIPGNAYDFFTGSSFSTAYVSGVVALIRQRKPHVSAAVVQELLQLTSSDASGFTNACNALARVVNGDDCPQDEKTGAIADRTR